MTLPVPLEHDEQRRLFQWAACQRVTYPDLQWLYAIPNGGKRSKATAGKLKAEGVKPGVPDVALDVARGGWFGLRLELKRRKKSHVSDVQDAWHRRLWAQGYKVEVCYGWEQASVALIRYLALPPTRVADDTVAA